MKWHLKFPTVFLLCLANILVAQEQDSAAITTNLPDSTQTLSPDSSFLESKKYKFVGRLFKEDYPNPKKALLISAVIPGGGQIYNKRWWKLPFVYGGYFGLILAADFNTKNYRRFRDAYIAELAGEEHLYSNIGLDASDLKRIRDGYDKNKQLSYIGIFALHILQGAEAFVDCHLKTFDVSDDLSMRVKPNLGLTTDGTAYFGLGLSFSLTD